LAGVVEFALLMTSIGGVVPLLLLVGGVAALAWGVPRLFPSAELAESEHARAPSDEETGSEEIATAGSNRDPTSKRDLIRNPSSDPQAHP
jgi:hypothetical protein